MVYFWAIAWIILGLVKISRNGEKQHENILENKISVIVPVRNEAKTIVKCLKAIQNQNFGRDSFEVIIVNDHSTDNTLVVIKDFIENTDLNIELYSLSDNTSKKEALALGIEKSKYDLIATTDADCIVKKDWLTYISNAIGEHCDMLLGPVMFQESHRLLGGFQTLDMLALQGIEFGALAFQTPILNNAANLAYSKKTFKGLGGLDNFNTPSGDDVFLLEKFQSKGKRIRGVFLRDFIVETAPQISLSSLFQQRLRWASKSKYYTNKSLLFFSTLILIENLTIIFIYFGIPLVEKYRFYLGILLFSKWLIDFILLFLMADFFKRRSALFYFIPVQILYPIYIVLIGLASMFMKFEWKDRNFNG